MGFPSRRARTKSSNRAPGEILIEEWVASGAEKALVSIHPERFESPEQVALSALFVIGNEVHGSRRNLGSLSLGVQMIKETGTLGYTADDKGKHANQTLNTILKSLGDLPEGFAEMPEPTVRAQTTRMLKFMCVTCKQVIRSAGNHLEVLCMHGGKPEHGQPATPFVQQQPKAKTAQSSAAAEPPQPQPSALSPEAQNRVNLATLVRGGSARIASHARNFGVEAPAV